MKYLCAVDLYYKLTILIIYVLNYSLIRSINSESLLNGFTMYAAYFWDLSKNIRVLFSSIVNKNNPYSVGIYLRSINGLICIFLYNSSGIWGGFIANSENLKIFWRKLC